MRLTLALLVWVSVTSSSLSDTLPKSFTLCKRTDSKVEKCIRNEIQKAIPAMVPGLPQFGIQPIDPLQINELKIEQGSGPISLNMIFSNCSISGYKAAIVDAVKFDPFKKNSMLQVDISIPKDIVIKSNYNFGGKVLLLPVREKGSCTITFGPMKVLMYFKTTILTEKGEDYMKVEDVKFSFDTKFTKFNFKISGNNTKQALQFNDFANQNSKVIVQELKPAISESLGLVFKDITNKIFKKVPYKHLFV